MERQPLSTVNTNNVSRLRAPSTVVKKDIILPSILTTTTMMADDVALSSELSENIHSMEITPTSLVAKRRSSSEEPQPKRPPAAVTAGKVVSASSAAVPASKTVVKSTVVPKKPTTTTTSVSIAAVKPKISVSTVAKPSVATAIATATATAAATAKKPSTSIPASTPVSAASVPGKRAAWDYKGRLEDMEQFANALKSQAHMSQSEVSHLQVEMVGSQTELLQLQSQKRELENSLQLKEREVSEAAAKIRELESQLRVKDSEKAAELSSLNSKLIFEQENFQTQMTSLRRERDATERLLKETQEEVSSLRSKLSRVENDLHSAESSIKHLKNSLEETSSTLFRREDELRLARDDVSSLRFTISKLSNEGLAVQMELKATKDTLTKSQSDHASALQEIERLSAIIRSHEQTIVSCEQRIREDESTRRKLHNTIQELKGNIRVFCRVRPLLPSDHQQSGKAGNSSGIAKMDFPDKDGKSIVLFENTTGIDGKNSSKQYEFAFDKVFLPTCSQSEVFEEISQLVQSALDGYNVCIFAYGQTGSGKTYTMEGPALPTVNSRISNHDSALSVSQQASCGMIPRAVAQIFTTAKSLESKGWKYDMEAMFLEIYNETINDLLGDGDLNKKHDIKIRADKPDEVFVTDTEVVRVENEAQVFSLLHRASQNRAVAETQCNSRSSRSHSIFRLKLTGKNSITGESCEGILNLVDLAGSERLANSGAQGDRLKETQAINKSLAHLGNVIMALANKQAHIPYRDSKLTYLLQNSLGGNSKTLMFVNISPREESLSESVCSLRFATKVNSCNIGTAQKRLK